jgi:hypothetical protein
MIVIDTITYESRTHQDEEIRKIRVMVGRIAQELWVNTRSIRK